jgi:hypothetical protein
MTLPSLNDTAVGDILLYHPECLPPWSASSPKRASSADVSKSKK